MISYLSLKRKKPVMDEHNIPKRIQPVQLETDDIDVSNTIPQLFSLSAIPSAEIQPTATTTNHFCLSFIPQFNTFKSIIVVTQVL